MLFKHLVKSKSNSIDTTPCFVEHVTKCLKKQGILPLTFNNSDDYDLIDEKDRISIIGLSDLSENQPVEVLINKSDGETLTIKTNHSMSDEQIEWFKAGSALNLIRQKTKS